MQSYLRRDVTGCCRLSHEKFNVEDNDVFILFCFFLTFFRVEKGGKKTRFDLIRLKWASCNIRVN